MGRWVIPAIIVRLGLEFGSFPLTPPSPSGRGRALARRWKFGHCGCLPASLSFVFVAHDNQARSDYQGKGECFPLHPAVFLGERDSTGTALEIRTLRLRPRFFVFRFSWHTTTKLDRITQARANVPPLPEGEGRGEGGTGHPQVLAASALHSAPEGLSGLERFRAAGSAGGR
jgi:hypothetical protein